MKFLAHGKNRSTKTIVFFERKIMTYFWICKSPSQEKMRFPRISELTYPFSKQIIAFSARVSSLLFARSQIVNLCHQKTLQKNDRFPEAFLALSRVLWSGRCKNI